MLDGSMESLPQGRHQEQGVSPSKSIEAACPKSGSLLPADQNYRRILTYLIPCHLINDHTLPTKKLLEPYPRLQQLFLPLCQCIKRGELHKFDLALQEGEDEFVKRRIYLTLERGRDIALRNLLRKVFIARGFEEAKPGEKPVRRTRVPVAEFAAAISLGSEEKIDNDEVECLLANMIYKVSCLHSTLFTLPRPPFSPHKTEVPLCRGCLRRSCRQGCQTTAVCLPGPSIPFIKHPVTNTPIGARCFPGNESLLTLLFDIQGHMKGYISRQHGMVVLSKSGAFPGTGV
jgi:hypothetical protein